MFVSKWHSFVVLLLNMSTLRLETWKNMDPTALATAAQKFIYTYTANDSLRVASKRVIFFFFC